MAGDASQSVRHQSFRLNEATAIRYCLVHGSHNVGGGEMFG